MSNEHDFLDNLRIISIKRCLREISNDDLTPKKRKLHQEGEIFADGYSVIETVSDPEPLYE